MDVNCQCITDQKDKYELEVFECCRCGGHLGIDGSWLVWLVMTSDKMFDICCPYCGQQWLIDTEGT